MRSTELPPPACPTVNPQYLRSTDNALLDYACPKCARDEAIRVRLDGLVECDMCHHVGTFGSFIDHD